MTAREKKKGVEVRKVGLDDVRNLRKAKKDNV
jgi:hypothetical protein